MEKLVVIKKILPHLAEDGDFIKRFVDEAQVAVKLQHANIAQVFEVGRVGSEYFLALEYVEGRDLRRTLSLLAGSGRGLPIDLALLIAREVANGLSYAHRRTNEAGEGLDLVHCDISPPNIMVSFEGETKIIDFGVSKSALTATATDPKRGFGKFGYMSPEQLIRGVKVDYRSDIYAVGVSLYEMLTGCRLYPVPETPDYRELAKLVTRGKHPLPSDHDLALAPFDALVDKALCADPEDRYQTAAEFRDAIQRSLVEVNPTINPDQLGALMRFMFADEVIQQKQELDAVDPTDLDVWQQELTAHGEQTVSIALSGQPFSVTKGIQSAVRGAVRERDRIQRWWLALIVGLCVLSGIGIATMFFPAGSQKTSFQVPAATTAGFDAATHPSGPVVTPLRESQVDSGETRSPVP